MQIILSIIYFCLVLGILVFVHELGHLLAAKRFGVYCKEFAIGMGPTLFKYKKPHWETTYSIRALPLGGFVSMAGEPGEEDMDVPKERTMLGIAPWKRIIVMLAGIFMNFVLAIVLYVALFSMNGVVQQPLPIVTAVSENSPAAQAGIMPGDVIKSLEFSDGSTIKPKTFSELQTGVQTYQDRELKLTVDRAGQDISLSLNPVKDEASNAYLVGIQGPQATRKPVNIIEAVPYAFAEIGSVIGQMMFLLSRVVRGIGADNLGGPIAIFGMTAQITNYGFIFFMNLLAVLSINLAVVNLIPIPIMDGGRVLLTIIEKIIGRPLSEKVERGIMVAGLVFMMGFFVFITFNDLSRWIAGLGR